MVLANGTLMHSVITMLDSSSPRPPLGEFILSPTLPFYDPNVNRGRLYCWCATLRAFLRTLFPRRMASYSHLFGLLFAYLDTFVI